MRFDENADLDTSSIEDLRGSGGGGGGGLGGRVALGGGGLGIVGLILYFVVSALGGGSGLDGLTGVTGGQTPRNSNIAQECQRGGDANTKLDCEMTGVINSVNGYWADAFSRSGQTYRIPRIVFFDNGVNTGGCGSATSAAGPFYCPADSKVYIDLTFFDELENRFGAQGGPFARAYVIAHEYGHHVQNLLGTNSRVRAGDSGPTSGSVRLELQADCYAGVWANHAENVPTATGRPLITEVDQNDIRAALDTAQRIGDDYIQSNLGGGRVDQSQFTHGTSAQREKWYTVGYRSGDPAQCDTFARGVNLG
jgi:hypothetical protein